MTGSGESVTLIYNAAGALIFQPSSNPAAGTEIFQIKNSAGTVQAALSSDGRVYANDGAVGTPGVALEGDKDTGLYGVSANVLGLGTGGAERARLSSSGLSLDGGTNFMTGYDATAPVTQAYSDAAAAGSATTAARRDHRHGMPASASGPTSGTGPGASTLGGSASAGTDGIYSRDGHAHAITATTSEAFLAADVTMTNANQWYDGPSVSLVAGTWLVMANVAISGVAANSAQARLWDGTTDYATGGGDHGVGYPGTIAVAAIITLGSTTTIKVSCASDGAGKTIDAALGNPAAGGNKLSSIRALKLAA